MLRYFILFSKLITCGKKKLVSTSNTMNKSVAELKCGFYLNDVKLISDDWVQEMMGVCQRPDVGVWLAVRTFVPRNSGLFARS